MPFSCKDPCDGLQGLDNPGSSPHLQILDLLTSSDANMLFPNRGTFRVSRNQDLISLASWGSIFVVYKRPTSKQGTHTD